MSTDFHGLLLSCASEEGFPLAGALDLDLAAEALVPHVARYDRWLASRSHGAMEYLSRGRDRRANPRLVFPEAQSILCVAIPYPRRPGGAPSAEAGPRYARYIHGRDYHDELKDKLERVMRKVADRDPDGAALRWKACVDTSAVLERSWAALAGLGWIGKNTLLIHPKHGSYLFLAEVLINRRTGKGPSPLPDYCGNCTRCLKACPTDAIREPHWVDSNLCVSYWTLEKRGGLDLSEAQKRAIGPWIAGCDLCQEACPFNIKPVRQELESGPSPVSGTADSLQDWLALLREDLEAYRGRISESALSRVKPAQFSRNLAITLANAVISGEVPASPRLRALVAARTHGEQDEAAKLEWRRCLEAVDSPSR